MVSVGFMFISSFLKEKTTSINSFVMWDVSIQWRDIKRDKQGIIRKIVNGGEFVKKISSIFDVGRYSADQRFEMKIDKLWNAFNRVIVGRDYGPTGIISPYTDVVLFFFSFFSKTSACSGAKRAREKEK